MGNFLLHVYMSDCQHDKSDRCYFYIFKNKFVVYSFLFLLCRAIFKLTQVDTFTVINYEMSVFSQMVWQSSESQNSVGKTLKGQIVSALPWKCPFTVLMLTLQQCLQIYFISRIDQNQHIKVQKFGREWDQVQVHCGLIINELIF